MPELPNFPMRIIRGIRGESTLRTAERQRIHREGHEATKTRAVDCATRRIMLSNKRKERKEVEQRSCGVKRVALRVFVNFAVNPALCVDQAESSRPIGKWSLAYLASRSCS